MSAPRWRRTRLLAGVLALIVAVGACTQGAKSLDRAATERAVLAALADRVVPVPSEVDCPANIDRGADEVVTCQALLPDQLGTVRVEVRQRDGGDGLNVSLIDAVIDRAAVAESLHGELVEAYGRSFTVTCGEAGPEVMAPGDRFDCEASDEQGSRTVRAEVADSAGTITFDLGAGPSTTTTTVPVGSAPA